MGRWVKRLAKKDEVKYEVVKECGAWVKKEKEKEWEQR